MKGFSIQKILFFIPIVLIVIFTATPFQTIDAADCPEGQYCVLAPIPNFEGPITSSFKVGDYVVAIFKVGIGLAGVLAVIMIIIGGISYMMSEMVGSKEEAKSRITNAIFGLLLALGAYAILNTINPDILCFRFLGSDCGQEGEGQQNNGGNNGGGNVTPPVVPNPPVVTPDPNSGGQLNESCGLQQRDCTNPDCGQYANAIAAAANGDQEMIKILKAIMVVESSCDVSSESHPAQNDDGSWPEHACGLFQLQESAAAANRGNCTNATATCQWLKNPNNAQASACIAKNYLINLRARPNAHGEWRNAFAAYNGGPSTVNGALGISQNCQNEVSCLNGTEVQRWECPWDDDAHTVPNTGYNETRSYVKQVSYCVANPGF